MSAIDVIRCAVAGSRTSISFIRAPALLGSRPPGAHRALHVAGHPLIGAAHVERRLVGTVQGPDPVHVARSPLRHVALRPGVGPPQPFVGGNRGERLESEPVAELGERLLPAVARRGRQVGGEPLRRDEAGEHALVLRPRGPEDALGFGETVLSAVAPERPVVRGDELRGQRVPLPMQRLQARVGDALDDEVAERTRGQRAHDRAGRYDLAGLQLHCAAAGSDLDRPHWRAQPDPTVELVGHPQRHGRRSLGDTKVFPLVVGVQTLARRARALAQQRQQRGALERARAEPQLAGFERAAHVGRRTDAAQPARHRQVVERDRVRVRPGVVRVHCCCERGEFVLDLSHAAVVGGREPRRRVTDERALVQHVGQLARLGDVARDRG